MVGKIRKVEKSRKGTIKKPYREKDKERFTSGREMGRR
jgi:hypothetical protein